MSQVDVIDGQIVSLIETTFTINLNSSEGAFDLLSKFQNVKTREKIKDLLAKQYESVLRKYEKELQELENLFEEGKANPPISKNMPPNAGNIAWAYSIMGRIRAPINKFKQKHDQLASKTFKQVALKYVEFAKKLNEKYVKDIFDRWETENTQKALELLK